MRTTCVFCKSPLIYGRRKCRRKDLQGGLAIDIRLPVGCESTACFPVLSACVVIYPVMARLANVLQVLMIQRYVRITYIVRCQCDPVMHYLSDIAVTYLA